ncbi:MAG: AMP-binding protein, partial [Chitinophagaceae bacterium]|nr:AMP-binding protein [Rubrivivax sp.]
DVVHVPLPLFFTPAQLTHALQAAGVDTLLTLPAAAARWPQAPAQPRTVAAEALVQLRLPPRRVPLPTGTSKITFTSGTTGAPKGVCLSRDALQGVAAGVVEALAPLGITRHLSALPYAVLLENIAGLMATRAAGATCISLPLAQLGLQGSSSFDAALFQAAVQRWQPHSVILLPQMLRAWAGHLQHSGQRAPASLKLVAVGGAATGAGLVEAAQALGIPACEGYGLSEGASVQTLNLPGAQRTGSAGRALPHAQLRVAADGEILIAGTLFAGYLGDDTAAPDWWPSGDLGHLDEDGYLHVSGRKKNLLITGFGRNVSPEWVETALRDHPSIGQTVVFGDGEPALSAVVWPILASTADSVLQAAVDAANATLPDYARVQRWVRASAPFDVDSGQATVNGRPQRAAIWQRHAGLLAAIPIPRGVSS